MPKLFQAERHSEALLAELFGNAGWKVVLAPKAPPGIDLLIRRGDLQYVVEVKRAAESRRDRIVPLLAEAVLQAEAHAKQIPEAQPLAVVASPNLSDSVIAQALEFHKAYASRVSIGLIDDRGLRVFSGRGLESLNSSSSPDSKPAKLKIREPDVYPIFSDLGQWMLKVILAPEIDPRFLSAARKPIHNASELAIAAGVSSISASRLVRQLDREGFLDRAARQLQIARIRDLLEEWQAASRRAYKEIPCRWVIPGHGPKQLLLRLSAYRAPSPLKAPREMAGRPREVRLCLGLFAAAEALGVGFVHGVPPVVYVERLEPELLDDLGISSHKSEPADLYLRVPVPKESVFRAVVDPNGVPVSDALQVWLDVSNHPSRGKEQADHMRQRVLGRLLRR